MYLDHFKFNELPFTLTPNVDFFCKLKGHEDALNTVLFSLKSGEGFIKVIGEVGSGKTLLCRKLLETVGDEFVTAYIPNPDLNPTELRRAVARELNIDPALLNDHHEILTLINEQLLKLHSEGKRVVLLLDEAQALSTESLEGLRLLTNLETKTTKLLQMVLFGQPELDTKINQPNLRQLKQRISFSYTLPKMSREDLDTYLFHRLSIAGCAYGTLFTEKARDILFKASFGIPRIVNILCHKALLVAFGRGEPTINHKIMRVAVKDTDVAAPVPHKKPLFFALLSIGILISLAFLIALYQGMV